VAGIFINYRRGDSAGWAGRLSHELRTVLGTDQVFMDITTIVPGTDYPEDIKKSLDSVDVLVAVIGPRWLTATDEKTGRLRLHDPKDLVRMEIAAALKRRIRVVPVLVGGATMPAAKDLPKDLRGLSDFHAHEMSDTRWDYDQEQLIKFLGRATVVKNANANNIRPNGSAQEFDATLFTKTFIVISSCLFFLLTFMYGISSEGSDPSVNLGLGVISLISLVSTIFLVVFLILGNYLYKYRRRKRRT
jgi:hypothetical protein